MIDGRPVGLDQPPAINLVPTVCKPILRIVLPIQNEQRLSENSASLPAAQSVTSSPIWTRI